MKCSGERKRYRHILVYPAEAQHPILNPSLLVLVELHPLLVQVPHFLLDRRVDVNVLRPMWKKLDVAPILAQRTSQVEHNYPCMADMASDMAYEWLVNG